MDLKWLLVMAALSLVACEAKQPKEVANKSEPATVAVVSTPAAATSVPVVEPVAVKPVEAAAVPTTTVEPKLIVPPAPQVVVAPVSIQKPALAVTPPKSAAPVAPALTTASAADGVALGKKRNCFACHMIDKKIVGPAWKEVANKYRGDAGAQARLEAKIAKGGSGAWGSMVMPPQPQVTADERTALTKFILNLK
jgi:cytochrome c